VAHDDAEGDLTMERTPVAEQPLIDDATATPWAEARERLNSPEQDRTYWLATVRPDGRQNVPDERRPVATLSM
jgi:hypothetical protein